MWSPCFSLCLSVCVSVCLCLLLFLYLCPRPCLCLCLCICLNLCLTLCLSLCQYQYQCLCRCPCMCSQRWLVYDYICGDAKAGRSIGSQLQILKKASQGFWNLLTSWFSFCVCFLFDGSHRWRVRWASSFHRLFLWLRCNRSLIRIYNISLL